jgi:hypothetical protein
MNIIEIKVRMGCGPLWRKAIAKSGMTAAGWIDSHFVIPVPSN